MIETCVLAKLVSELDGAESTLGIAFVHCHVSGLLAAPDTVQRVKLLYAPFPRIWKLVSRPIDHIKEEVFRVEEDCRQFDEDTINPIGKFNYVSCAVKVPSVFEYHVWIAIE